MSRPSVVQAKQDIDSLRQAFVRNPGDLDVGLMLGSVLYKAGNFVASSSIFETVLERHPDHPQALLLLARSQARAGSTANALKSLSLAQTADPSNPQPSQVAVSLASQSRDWLTLLRIATVWTELQPHCIEAWQALSRAHFEESCFAQAIEAFQSVLNLEPNNAVHLVSAARLAIAAMRYDDARALLSSAHKLAPDSGELLYTLSRLHHMTGELEEAEKYCRSAIAIMPKFAPAYVALGTLREGRLDDVDVQVVSRLFNDNSVPLDYRAMLGFTLGDAYDKRQDYDQAFTAWSLANRINRLISEREGFVYRPEQVESEFVLLKEIFSEAISVELDDEKENKVCPIFVVGMPRSGTTLVESILASHSTVFGAGELPGLYDVYEDLMEVARKQGVDAARQLIRLQGNAWRQRYLDALPECGQAKYVVDKQPLNFRAVALIRLLFPASPIVHTQRKAIDVGFSIFRHKFAKNWPCAHSLSDIGHYYRFHEQVCRHWLDDFSEAIHIVNHAEVVKDSRTQIRQLLEFAGLAFEQACLSPHETKRPIATFSSVQVRQPVSDAYSNRSSAYTSHLLPLSEVLLSPSIN